MNRNTLTNITKRQDGWITADYGDYRILAKLSPENSEFGIDNGRIFKLELAHKNKTVAVYERGWEKYPTGQHETVMDEIIKKLEAQL